LRVEYSAGDSVVLSFEPWLRILLFNLHLVSDGSEIFPQALVILSCEEIPFCEETLYISEYKNFPINFWESEINKKIMEEEYYE